ncbi:MAG TPA: hypothetical protein VN946_03940 [Terriglobales bacterium]|nr:hypothetical protein [Terriglobales bacterium]
MEPEDVVSVVALRVVIPAERRERVTPSGRWVNRQQEEPDGRGGAASLPGLARALGIGDGHSTDL